MDIRGTSDSSGQDLLMHPPGPGQPAAAPPATSPAEPPDPPDPADISAPPFTTSRDIADRRGSGLQMKYRRPVGAWLLAVATLGGYGLFYWYKIHDELRQFDRRRHVSPGFELMSVFLMAWTIILPLMSVGSLAPKIRMAQSTAGLPQSCSGRRGVLLALLLGSHVIYYQRRLNEIIAVNAAGPGERIQLRL